MPLRITHIFRCLGVKINPLSPYDNPDAKTFALSTLDTPLAYGDLCTPPNELVLEKRNDYKDDFDNGDPKWEFIEELAKTMDVYQLPCDIRCGQNVC